jgi:Flp pilus assembly protein CpaB
MAKDRLFFLLSVGIFGIVLAYLFHTPTQPVTVDPTAPAPTTVEAPERAPSIQIMVANRDLTPGERLAEGDVSWRVLAPEDSSPSLIARDPLIEQWQSEAIVVREVAEGENVNRLDIAWPTEDPEGTQTLDTVKGKMAVPYNLTGNAATVQFLRPGHYIDIIFTSESELGFGTMSFVLLKDIRVLGVEKTGDFERRGDVDVFLEMSAREAEIFSYALQSGEINLGISNDKSEDDGYERVAELLMNSHSKHNFNSILITYLIRSLFPGVHVQVVATTEGFIVSGRIKDPAIAEKIRETLTKIAVGGEGSVVDLMKVEPQQVMICVKVLEVVRDYAFNLGINWQALLETNGGKVAFGAVFPRPSPLDPNYFFDASGIKIGDWTLSQFIDVIQERGCGKLLAEPNITTVSGEPARIFVGGEFPILIPQGGTLAGTVTVEFKEFGVILDFEPIVDINGVITLRVAPEVSSLDRQNSVVLAGFVIPGLTTRRAETVVKLWPGQSYAIAGLLQNEELDVHTGICGLDRLPLVGPLFRSTRRTSKQTELIIFLTPFLISSEEEVVAETPYSTYSTEMYKINCQGTGAAYQAPCTRISP